MRAKTREPYRVYSQDEFFAEDGLLAAGGADIDVEHRLDAEKAAGKEEACFTCCRPQGARPACCRRGAWHR